MVATHGSAQIPNALPAHLTTEAGMFGGFPAGAARCSPPPFYCQGNILVSSRKEAHSQPVNCCCST